MTIPEFSGQWELGLYVALDKPKAVTYIQTRIYLQARMFKYLFLFLFSSTNDCEFENEDGGHIRFISCQSTKIHTKCL